VIRGITIIIVVYDSTVGASEPPSLRVALAAWADRDSEWRRTQADSEAAARPGRRPAVRPGAAAAAAAAAADGRLKS
jgi:hypothetical protein